MPDTKPLQMKIPQESPPPEKHLEIGNRPGASFWSREAPQLDKNGLVVCVFMCEPGSLAFHGRTHRKSGSPEGKGNTLVSHRSAYRVDWSEKLKSDNIFRSRNAFKVF